MTCDDEDKLNNKKQMMAMKMRFKSNP